MKAGQLIRRARPLKEGRTVLKKGKTMQKLKEGRKDGRQGRGRKGRVGKGVEEEGRRMEEGKMKGR